jgi:hypothetical protein
VVAGEADDGDAGGVVCPRDGVIGVSWVGRDWPAGACEHPATSTPATSTDVAKIEAMRIPSG